MQSTQRLGGFGALLDVDRPKPEASQVIVEVHAAGKAEIVVEGS